MTDLRLTRRRLESLLGQPVSEGNAVTLLRNGQRIFPAMLAAIRNATEEVDLLTYIYWSGAPAEDFAQALAERAAAGVRVRVLVDAVGGARMDRSLMHRMTGGGARVEFFRPPWLRSPFAHNHRTHRKVLVVDGVVAFTGGVGIAEEWGGDARGPDEWRDTQVSVRGPAVAGLRAAFVQNWSETTGAPDVEETIYPQLSPAGSDAVHVVRGSAVIGWGDMNTAWYGLLTAARSRITLQTAYFAPDDLFLKLVLDARARGVQIDVLVPGPNYDKFVSRLGSERLYQPLLDGGVRLWRFQPTMLHTKILTIDDEIVMVGSSNFNRRSLDHDEEVAMILYDAESVPQFIEDFEADLARSVPVDAGEWRNRPARQRLAEAAIAPIQRYL